MTQSGTFRWTAKRRLAPGHAAESQYSHTFGATSFTPSTEVVRIDERSAGGATESTFVRMDQMVTIEIGPVPACELPVLNEFCASIITGQVFQAWPFGDEAEPLLLRVVADTISVQRALQTGNPGNDMFTAVIQAVQASPEADDGESVDIYSPVVQGDPPPPGVLQFICGEINIYERGWTSGGTGSLIINGTGYALRAVENYINGGGNLTIREDADELDAYPLAAVLAGLTVRLKGPGGMDETFSGASFSDDTSGNYQITGVGEILTVGNKYTLSFE